jgi:hypothetical protein
MCRPKIVQLPEDAHFACAVAPGLINTIITRAGLTLTCSP